LSSSSREPPSQPWLVLDGRLVRPSAYRPATFVDFENTAAWWSALAVLGALILGFSVLAGARYDESTAVAGVALFFVTAVLAGVERIELATAFGAAGVIGTSLGISLVLGTDPSLAATAWGFGIVGGAALLAGVVGALRTRTAPGRE
jgi:hypothetical protein